MIYKLKSRSFSIKLQTFVKLFILGLPRDDSIILRNYLTTDYLLCKNKLIC